MAFPNGIYSYVPGGIVAAPSWPQADLYVNCGVPVPAHESPMMTGMYNRSYLLSSTTDSRPDIEMSNRLFAVTLDNTLAYTDNMAQYCSSWYF